jgi:hypothetical protein
MGRSTIFFIAVALVGGAYEKLTEADRDEHGNIAESGDLGVFSLRVGDCFNYGSVPVGDEEIEEREEIEEVEAIPCAEPHDYETYALVTVDPSIETYPGIDAMFEIAYQECFNSFEDYVGRSYQESLLTYWPIVPTSESWSRIDARLIQCHLADMEEEKLTDSMLGSGI